MKNVLLSCAPMSVGALLIALVLGVSPAHAQSTVAASTNVNASANVLSSCEFTSSQSLNFGVYDPVVAHKNVKPTAEGSVSLRCSQGSYSLTISNGSNSRGVLASQFPAGYPETQYGYWNTFTCGRNMVGPSNRVVPYAIGATPTGTYSASIPGQIYSSGPTPPNSPSCSQTLPIFKTVAFNSLEPVVVPIYARITEVGASRLTAGAYSDTLTVSVTF